jgi:hypothetical protein
MEVGIKALFDSESLTSHSELHLGKIIRIGYCSVMGVSGLRYYPLLPMKYSSSGTLIKLMDSH